MKAAWKKFRGLPPVLFSCYLSFKTRSHVYSSYVLCPMFNASETWQLAEPGLQCRQQNDRAMIRHICSIRRQDIVAARSSQLHAWLVIEDLDLILKERRLRCCGHVEHSSGAVKTAFDIQVNGTRAPGRPKMTLKQLTGKDCREWNLGY